MRMSAHITTRPVTNGHAVTLSLVLHSGRLSQICTQNVHTGRTLAEALEWARLVAVKSAALMRKDGYEVAVNF